MKESGSIYDLLHLVGSLAQIFAGQPLIPDALVAVLECFGEHACASYGSHEVGVAAPAWDDMQMDVFGDPGARSVPDIDAHVEALRFVYAL